MRPILTTFTAALILMATATFARADDTDPPLPAASDASATAPAPGSPDAAVSTPDAAVPNPEANPDAPPPSDAQLIDQGRKTADAIRGAVSDGTMTGIMAAISAGLFFLLMALQRWGRLLMAGNTIRLITVFGGAFAALAGYFGAGMSWGEALKLFFAGPGAMAINELLGLVGLRQDAGKPPKAKAAA